MALREAGNRPAVGNGPLRAAGAAAASTLGGLGRRSTLDGFLFAGALVVLLVTRLYGLERFPIYFFTDEAVQTVSAADFLDNGFRNSLGELLPTYFQNGPYLNLSLSVYAQILPYLLFGFSEVATRATSALVALSGTAAVGLMLREVFRVRFWWAGTLLLAATPAWFLHSRTAFETVLAVSFYAWFLYFYCRVRTSGPRNLYLALLFAALAFYSYNPAQIVVAATLAGLALSDLAFYRRNPGVALRGLALIALLAVPYVRFYAAHGGELHSHLRLLGSYWTTDVGLGDKLSRFWHEYAFGLNPRYWYTRENDRDLVRHFMKGYGNILAVTLPFALVGIVVCLKNVRSSAHRALLIALLACPLGGALVATSVTRDLVFVVPAALLSGLGVATVLTPLTRRVPYRYLAAGLFVLLSGINLAMLRDALADGPTWYRDYGLGGMQYGARQVTAAVDRSLEESPGTRVVLSPTWANGTDVLVRFFLPHDDRVVMGSIDGWALDRLELRDSTLFVMTPEEYDRTRRDSRFSSIRVEQTVAYPDGKPGFYFVRLRYSPSADAIFAVERRERMRPVNETISLGGEQLAVAHSRFDIGRIEDLFDGDSFTLARTLEANPSVIRLSFRRARRVSGITVTTATTRPRLRVSVTPAGSIEPLVFATSLFRTAEQPTLTISFGRSVRTRTIDIRVRELDSAGPTHVHIREIRLE